jgi:tetratricopeptide (TPR) repeat protein
MANSEIENNNIDQAIFILEAGIKIFPQYAAAYLLLGKAYILIGDYPGAYKYIKKGSELIYSKKTYDFYLKELENVKKQRSLFIGSSRNMFLPENESPQQLHDNEILVEKAEEPPKSVDDNLEQIAKDISIAKIPEISEGEISQSLLLDNDSGSHLIVSETLAKIYTTQGEFAEAIEVYKKLTKKNPQKEEYYKQKMDNLKSQLEF